MSCLKKTYYDNELKTFITEEYTDWGMKKYDNDGNLIAYEKIADDDVINDNINEEIDEPDEFFYRLYPCEKRKFEKVEK